MREFVNRGRKTVVSRQYRLHCLAHIADATDEILRTEVGTDHLLLFLENISHVLTIEAAKGDLPNEEQVFQLLSMAIHELDGARMQAMSREQLLYLLESHFKVGDIAKQLGVSKRTIRRRRTEYGLSVRQTYSNITDEELSRVIFQFISNCPNAGIRTVTGHLNSLGISGIFA
ncbi:unnamed protein product [Arctogadus glacialis]